MTKTNILQYKGYTTEVHYSAEDGVLFGKIEGIGDLVNFESDTLGDVEAQFHAAVDDYLAFCKDTGTEPEKPCSGVFQVRISPETHRLAQREAKIHGKTLNRFVTEAIENALAQA